MACYSLPPTTSKKHQAFVTSPMGHQPVSAIPGIGPVYGGQLNKAGIYMASEVFGHYLTKQRDMGRFIEWLAETTGANNSYHMRNSYNGLNGYFMTFM